MKKVSFLAFASISFMFLPTIVLADQEQYNQEGQVIADYCENVYQQDATIPFNLCLARVRSSSNRSRARYGDSILNRDFPDQRNNSNDRQIWQNMFPSSGGGRNSNQRHRSQGYSNESSFSNGTCSPIIINSEIREVNC
jgi:hypothetical protein